MTTKISSLVAVKAQIIRSQHLQDIKAGPNRLEGGVVVAAAPMARRRVELRSRPTISMPF